MKAFKTILLFMALLAASQISAAEVTSDGDNENVQWLSTSTAEIYLVTGENYLQYRYNGDGTRDNSTMPGAVNMLAVNFFSIYYNLADSVDITHASLQYMICPEGESEGLWNTIECNEVNTLVSPRKNTHRSSFNEQKIISRDLAPGNYVLRIMFQLIDDEGQYYFFGKDNDNFVFYFSMNEPMDPEIVGISMPIMISPGEEQYIWAEAGEPFETIDLTSEEPLDSMTINEVYIFALGNFGNIDLVYKVCDENGVKIYDGKVTCPPDEFGNWCSDPDNSLELLDDTKLQNNKAYNLYFWAEGVIDEQVYTLDNDGDNYLVKFVYGGQGSGCITGDITGDDTVDVSDVNAVINIMLGKVQASNYPGNADLNGDGDIDVSDVNIVINIMLGKE